MRTTRAKNEIQHRVLDAKKNDGKSSARYTKIGTIVKTELGKNSFKLKDKIVFPVNVCPHCGSKATFHRIIQESGDLTGNVWDATGREEERGMVRMKFDYCLDCHKEFLMELYILKKVKKEVKEKKRKGFWNWFK